MAGEAAAKEPMPLTAKLWLAGLFVMLLLAGSAWVAQKHLPQTVAMTSVEGIERLSGLEFPPSTGLLAGRYSAPAGSQGRFAWAALRMPRQAALDLLGSDRFGDTFSRSERVFEGQWVYGLEGDAEHWRPDAADEFASASTVQDPSGEAWDVRAEADLDAPNTAIVYLQMTR